VTVWFKTTEDDKDPDTLLSVFVRAGKGQVVAVVASAENVGGMYFPSDNSARELGLTVTAPYSNRSQVENGTVTIVITPNGHDTWKFDFTIVISFENASAYQNSYSGVVLSEAARERTYALTSAK
jgi:hypothetical protein